jgi:hypothetical protein
MTVPDPDGEVLVPRAEDLIESLRAFGYDLPTALADLVDNSIAARARHVRVEFDSDPGSAWVAVVDDGHGMAEGELRDAMRFAGNPNAERDSGDLGRFGLGLKTASLSQARRLTVLSRTAATPLIARTWDIDHVTQHRQWLVITEPDPKALSIVEQLGFTGVGTVVLWRNLDKVGGGAALRRRIGEAAKELSLLFHRFIASGRLSLSVGGRVLAPMDPYLKSHPATIDRGYDDLEYDGHHIRINPVVLPHPSRLNPKEAAVATGPGGLLARQGFYVYRGDRLVVAGGWLGISGLHNSGPTRLARLSMEIPPDADLTWEVDVRKSTVRPPALLEARITEIAVDLRARSERVFTHRGTPVPRVGGDRDLQVVWQQVRRQGRSSYTLNRDHPLLAGILSREAGDAVEGILQLIESTLPVTAIEREVSAAGAPGNGQVAETPDVEETLAAFRAMLAGLPQDPVVRATMAEQLARAEPFNRFPGLVQEIIDFESPKEF